MPETNSDGKEQIKHYSKSNLKAVCRKGYSMRGPSSLVALLGSVRHKLIEKKLMKNDITPEIIALIANSMGVPSIFHDDLVDSHDSWMEGIGMDIIDNYDIIDIENNSAPNFKHGKRIAMAEIGRDWGLQGMLDFVGNRRRDLTICVIDWKSGMLPDDHKFENMVNGVLAILLYGFDRVEASLYSIMTGMREPLVLERKNLNEYLDCIEKRVREIEAEDETALTIKTNEYCYGCCQKDTCQEYLTMLNGKATFADIDDKKLAIAEIFRLRSLSTYADREKEAIEAIYKDPKVLFGYEHDGYIYELKSTMQKVQNVQKTYDALKALGINPDPAMKIVGAKVDEIVAAKTEGMSKTASAEYKKRIAQIMRNFKEETGEISYSIRRGRATSKSLSKPS